MSYCTVKWANHSPNVKKRLEEIYTGGKFTDVAIASNNRILRAHKVILASCSAYFENIFLMYDMPNMVIAIEEVPFPMLKLVLDFIYKGEIDVDMNDLQNLLKAGVLLKVRGLDVIDMSDVLAEGGENDDDLIIPRPPSRNDPDVEQPNEQADQLVIQNVRNGRVEDDEEKNGNEANITPPLSEPTDPGNNSCASPINEKPEETTSKEEEFNSITNGDVKPENDEAIAPESSDGMKAESSISTDNILPASDEHGSEENQLELEKTATNLDSVMSSENEKVVNEQKMETSDQQTSETSEQPIQREEDGRRMKRLSRAIKKPARIAELEFTSPSLIKRTRKGKCSPFQKTPLEETI